MQRIVSRLQILVLIVSGFLPVSAACKTPSGSDAKVVLVGIDGFEWSVINQLIKENKMPVVAELIENGASGDLGTPADCSAAIWTTIATGKKRTEHGITGWTIYEPGQYSPSSPMSYHRKVKALWNILSDRNREVGVISYLITRPPEKVNGFMITDVFAVRGKNLFPEDLPDLLKDCLGSPKYEDSMYNIYRHDDQYSESVMDNLNEFASGSSVVRCLYEELVNKRYKPALLMFYVRAIDLVSHKFWKFMEPEHFKHPVWELDPQKINRYGNVIKDFYQRADKLIGNIIEKSDESAIVLVCSDHGFRRKPVHPVSIWLRNLNVMLEEMGFLKFKKSAAKSKIDFSVSEAYYKPGEGICINLKGRESHGIVGKGKQYEELVTTLIEKLAKLEVIETGDKLFKVWRAKEGRQADITIGLRAQTNYDLLSQHTRIGGKICALSAFCRFSTISGTHKDPGVIIIRGKGIKRSQEIKGAHILDITPTILYLLGLPVAEDMSGKVLVQAIDEKIIEKNPVRYIPTYEGKRKKLGRFEPRPMDREQLEKLRSLGYVQ